MDTLTTKIVDKMNTAYFKDSSESLAVVTCIAEDIPIYHARAIQVAMLAYVTTQIRMGKLILVEKDNDK